MTPPVAAPADLRALARSVMCVGFEGSAAGTAPLEELRAFAPGGIVLFARNAAGDGDLRALIAALRACGEPPPLVALDQEGGRVARIASDAVAQLPSAMAVGAAGDVRACEQLGVLVGRDLAALGISIDFAPCADLALDPRNTVIGNRSYGEDPHAVARFAIAFARGLERGGVGAAIKHFPGHGSTHVDSHTALPRVAVAAATLRARDIVPFGEAVAADAASLVMSAHVVAEAFDRANPATLSSAVLTGLLRGELGFQGVIVTDCLEMDAAGDAAAAAPRALAAGADLLLFSHRLELAQRAADTVATAVERGELLRARLDDAARRVAALRDRFALPAPFGGEVDAALPLAVARRAVTVVRGEVHLRPGLPVTVVSFEGHIGDGAAGERTEPPSLSAALRARGWRSELMRVPLEPDAGDVDLLVAQLRSLGDRNYILMTRRAQLYRAQAAAATRILGAVPGALVISAREPYDAALFPHARNVACTYGDERISLEGCADVLSGRAEPEGRLPVTIDRTSAVR
ncbi:MAG: beta-N-acetylhexosaminidase [Candidatus Velthaea sp.]